MVDDDALYRRELMKISLAGLFGGGVTVSRAQDEHLDADLSVDYDFFIRPDDPAVQAVAADTAIAEHGDGYRLALPERVTFDYVDDDDAFDRDHWQLPDEFAENDWNGDCEDYAIMVASILEAKGYDARAVGDFSTPVNVGNPGRQAASHAASMLDGVADRIAGGDDDEEDVGHMVVETVIDGEHYVVDNQIHPIIWPRDGVYADREFDPDVMFGPDETATYSRDWYDG